MTNRLKDKVAVVTGAARGIGEAVARAFADEGAFVILTDVDDALGTQVANDIGATRARYLRLDVRDEANWIGVVDDVLSRESHLDILVNNAGITGFESGHVAHDPEHTALEGWHAVHATNLDGTFLGCKHGIRAMRKTGNGSIINMSSRSGMVGIPGAAAYASSKAAIRNHSKSVALYCAGQGLNIRCNSVHPAAVLTPMWEPMLGEGPEREARMAQFVAGTPVRRFGKPEEVAAVCVLLASDEAAYMTGTELTIDGGILAGSAAAPGQVEE